MVQLLQLWHKLTGFQFFLKQIRCWFKNHKQRGEEQGAGESRARVLDLTGKRAKARKLSAPNAYSKLYFKKKVKPVVEQRWREKYLKEHPEHKPTDKFPRWPILFQNKILHEFWNAEPKELQDSVRKEFGLDSDESEGEEEAETIAPDTDDDPKAKAERERITKVQEYQKCVPPEPVFNLQTISCLSLVPTAISMLSVARYRQP